MNRTFIPVPKGIEKSIRDAANFSLFFNKWTDFAGNFNEPAELKANKKNVLKKVCENFAVRKKVLEDQIKNRYERTLSMLEALRKKGYKYRIVRARTASALIYGMGDEHPFENSMRFDWSTGLPYLPASAIKGVTRFVAELSGETSGSVRELFGSEPESTVHRKGSIQFLDGFPLEMPVLELDIMNNHFPDYYSDETRKTFPADNMDPNPVFFLVLKKGTRFYFPVIAGPENIKRNDEAGREEAPLKAHEAVEKRLQLATDFLKEALSGYGIGAKTMAGYGLFENIEIVSPVKTGDSSSQKAGTPQPEVIKRPFVQAFEALKATTNENNFRLFLQSLTGDALEWLKGVDLFAIPGFNAGATYVQTFLQAATLPAEIRKNLAQKFLEKINIRDVRKKLEKAEKKKSDEATRYKKMLELYDELKKIGG